MRENTGTATRKVFDCLRDDIISGDVPPGSKLKIADLCERFGTSGSPVREALNLLASSLLVEHIDRRGFRVSEISHEEFVELLSTRCWLEERALRESIRNGGKQWEEKVVVALFRLSQAQRRLDSGQADEEWEVCHKQFHMILLEECGSRILRDFCDDLYNQNVRYLMAESSGAYSSRSVFGEHKQIADAVIARDPDLAVKRLIEHYQTTVL